MPGDNGVISGYSTSSTILSVVFLDVTRIDSKYDVNWRKNIVHIITLSVDVNLKRQTEKKCLHYQKHYPDEQLIRKHIFQFT